MIFFSNKIYIKFHPPSNKDQDLRKRPPDTSYPSHSESQGGSLCGSLSGTPQREVSPPTPPPLQASGVTLLPSPCMGHAPPYPLLPGQGAEPELEAPEGWWRQRRVIDRDSWLCPPVPSHEQQDKSILCSFGGHCGVLTPPMGFPGGSDSKESACNAEDPGSIPGLGRSPGEGNGYPLQCFCLENSMDRGAWWATVPGVTQLDTTKRLSSRPQAPELNHHLGGHFVD